MPISDYDAKTATTGSFQDPARLSADDSVRWCFSCDTVLNRIGQSAFCRPCRAEYEVLLRHRRAIAKRADLPIAKRKLEELHELADAVRYDLGRLTVAYNADKQNLDRQMHVVTEHLSALLHHLETRIEDPRPPEERRTRKRN